MQNYQDGTVERLADDLFLIGHDDFSGKAVTSANPLDTALAGGVLAELALDGRIGIDRGDVYVADRRAWQESVTDLAVNEIIRRGDGHPARLWLEFMRPHVREHIGERLVGAGTVRRETGRGLSLRTSVRWPGVDPNRVARPRVRLAALLERYDQPLDARTATLAGLVQAAGMTRVMSLSDRSAIDRIGASRRTLPPVLADLLAAVDAVVA